MVESRGKHAEPATVDEPDCETESGAARYRRKFIEKLESAFAKSTMTLDEAIDEFENEHPELLRLLAQ